jgi:hypothetical protein
MRHASTREVFDYWNARRGSRFAPDRAEIEPGAIRRALGDSFIMAYDPVAGHPLRLAGTRVCSLFAREIKNEPFARLWDAGSKPPIGELLGVVADEAVGIVAGVGAQIAEGATIDLELLLLPLAYRGRTHVRMLGVLAPLSIPYWLGTRPIEALTLRTLRHLGTASQIAVAPRLMPADGSTVPAAPVEATRRSFVLYQGGRA